MTKGNASEALADLGDIVHSAEGFSAQQRVTVSLNSCPLHLRPRRHMLMMPFGYLTTLSWFCCYASLAALHSITWSTAAILLAYPSASEGYYFSISADWVEGALENERVQHNLSL